jgi:hypothetical protein
MIEIKVEHNTFETDSPFKAFTFLTALIHYDIEEGYANEIAELCHMLYIDFDSVNAVDLIDYVCEHYDSLPDDYNEILNILEGAL